MGQLLDPQQFGKFMAAQAAAIEASGLDPFVWIDANAASFREAWEPSEAQCPVVAEMAEEALA